MSIKLKVRQGGGTAAQPDLANLAEAREGIPIFDSGGAPVVDMAQRWEMGQASQGSYTYVDVDGSASYFHRPHAEIKLIEDDSGTDYVLAWGRMEGGNDTGRPATGPVGHGTVEHSAIQVMDCNIDLRGLPFRTVWERPAETSWERLQALQDRSLNGASSTGTTRRKTTNITVDRFTNDHLVTATDTVDLDATDYPVGTTPLDVMEDIFSQWDGKRWGVTLHHTESGTHKCLLVLDGDDNDSFQSPVKISDHLADWAPDDPDEPVLVPEWRRGAGKLSDNASVISGLISIYGGTPDNPHSLYVQTDDDEDEWETWVDVFNDDRAKGEVQAERRANAILNDRKRPYVTPQPSITLNRDQVTLITAGQSIQVKSVVINQGPDRNTYQWWRIAEIRWEPLPDGRWVAHLELGRAKNAGASNGGGGHPQPGSTSPEPAPEHDCDPETVTVCDHNVEDEVDDDPGGHYNPHASLRDTPAGNPDDAFIPYLHIGATQTTNLLTDWCEEGDIEAGGTYRAAIQMRTNSYYGVYRLQLNHDGTDALGTPSGTRIGYLYPHSDNTEYTITTDEFTIPSDATSAKIQLGATYGGWQWKDFVITTVVTPEEGTPGCDPDAVDYGDCPHESTHWLPSDYVLCRLQQIEDGALMGDLGDVDLDPLPDTGDVLVYDAGDEVWRPGDHGTIGGLLDNDHPQYRLTTDGGHDVISIVAAAGSTETLDLADGNVHDVTLTANCTLTLTGATNGVECTMTVLLRQGSGAPWLVTWPGSVEWVGGAAPTLQDDEDEWDIVTLMTLDGGTTWFGDAGGGTSGGAGGHTIKEDGTPLTARSGLNFGSGIIATDDAGNDETDVDLDWAEDADVSTQAFGDAAATGTSQEVARGGHKHAMPANPVTAHEAASDPHTGYVLESLGDAKGDLIGFSADNTPAKIGAGTEGQIPVARAAATPGIAWETRYGSFQLDIGDGTNVIPVGTVAGADIYIPFDLVLTEWHLFEQTATSGSITIHVYKDIEANWPPDSGDIISSAGGNVVMSSNTKASDTNLTDWTGAAACSAGDVLRFYVNSAASVKRIVLAFKFKRS